MILEVDQNFPQPGIIEHALELIKEGHGIFVYPTDTIYGLGCDIFDKRAFEKLVMAKNRPQDKKFSIIVSDLKMLRQYAVITKKQETLLKKYLPGPVTFILKASDKLPKYLTNEFGTVGIRIPRNRLSIELVKALNHPIITTSFNLGGAPVITDPSKTPKVLQKLIDVILDAGEIGDLGSTIVDLTGKKPIILREGQGKFKN